MCGTRDLRPHEPQDLGGIFLWAPIFYPPPAHPPLGDDRLVHGLSVVGTQVIPFGVSLAFRPVWEAPVNPLAIRAWALRMHTVGGDSAQAKPIPPHTMSPRKTAIIRGCMAHPWKDYASLRALTAVPHRVSSRASTE